MASTAFNAAATQLEPVARSGDPSSPACDELPGGTSPAPSGEAASGEVAIGEAAIGEVAIGAVAIGAVMKAEDPYILEWVAFHRLMGFDLLVADNGGQNIQTPLLKRLDALGQITRLDLTDLFEQPQIPAYNQIYHLAARRRYKYLGFIDADEFFEVTDEPLAPGVGARLIQRLFKSSDAAALSFNWLCLGDSGCAAHEPDLVLARFTRGAPIDHALNLGAKSFVRLDLRPPARRYRPDKPRLIYNPHVFNLSDDLYHHDGDADPARAGGDFGGAVRWRTARIRHAQIKSFEEYRDKKAARGDAMSKTKKFERYDRAFFDQANVNDVDYPLEPAFLDLLRQAIAELERAVGPLAPEDTMRPRPKRGLARAWMKYVRRPPFALRYRMLDALGGGRRG